MSSHCLLFFVLLTGQEFGLPHLILYLLIFRSKFMFYQHLALMILLNLFQLVPDQQILLFKSLILLLEGPVLVLHLSLVNLNIQFYLVIL